LQYIRRKKTTEEKKEATMSGKNEVKQRNEKKKLRIRKENWL